MRLVDPEHRVTVSELREMATALFGDLVKAVVDVRRGIMVVDAELHSDQEAFLLQEGSQQTDLWGINLYPELRAEGFVEFDSMINLRPSQHNRTRGIENSTTRERILQIVEALVIG